VSCDSCDHGIRYVDGDKVTECPNCAAVAKSGPLSPQDARKLTNEVKADASALWTKLLRLYEGQAHVALGYQSWGSYFKHEFGQTGTRGYQLLEAARVASIQPGLNERQARELAPVLREDPERVPEVYSNVVQWHGPEPTAEQVREVVRTTPTRRKRASRIKRLEGSPSWARSVTTRLRGLSKEAQEAQKWIDEGHRPPTELFERLSTARDAATRLARDLDRLLDAAPHPVVDAEPTLIPRQAAFDPFGDHA
jgi:hypothetical protein